MNNGLIVNKQEIKETAILALPDIIEKKRDFRIQWNQKIEIMKQYKFSFIKNQPYNTEVSEILYS